jgi:hypothetical protein
MPWFACLIALILCRPGAFAADELANLQVVVNAISDALEHVKVGGSVSWTGAGPGKSGSVVVTKMFFLADGTPCRAYARTTGNGRVSDTGPSSESGGSMSPDCFRMKNSRGNVAGHAG